MYISFDKEKHATLLIPQDEQRFWYTSGHWKEPFNCSNFLSDLLNINFNKLRNYYISTLTNLPSQLFDNAHDMESVTAFLQRTQIFPSTFECKATPYLLWQMGYNFETLMALYNALLLLKINNFSPTCAQEMCANVRLSFALQEDSVPLLRFLNTPQMMIIDLSERVAMDTRAKITLQTLATKLLQSSFCEVFLDKARSLSLEDFVNMYFPPELHGKQIVKTIYDCLSCKTINRHMRKEFGRISNDSYGKASYYNTRCARILTTSQIQKIPSNVIVAESHPNKFEWLDYFSKLYDRYQVQNEYCINTGNVFELLGLIVQQVTANGDKPKKCLYCNYFSFKLKKKACPVCAKKYAKAIDSEHDRATTRRRNKTSIFDATRDWYYMVKRAYLNLYDATYKRLEELAVHRIREKNYSQLCPKPLKKEDLHFHLTFAKYWNDISAQNEAEKLLLFFEPNADNKYEALDKLWKEYLLPSRFHKHVLPEGALDINITDLETVFKPHVGDINYLAERKDEERVKPEKQSGKEMEK